MLRPVEIFIFFQNSLSFGSAIERSQRSYRDMPDFGGIDVEAAPRSTIAVVQKLVISIMCPQEVWNCSQKTGRNLLRCNLDYDIMLICWHFPGSWNPARERSAAVTDMHCHILPCVDDGASSVEEACSMAWKAWENGTERIIATPHFCRPDQRRRLPISEFRRYVYLLQQGLQELGCGLELRSGMEVFATAELPKLMQERKLLTLADSRYLLVEFYFDEHETYICDTLRMVAERGFVPVIAHPERYHAVQRTPALAREWFSRGYIMQLNKGTILGRMGQDAKQTAWWLLERGLAHVVASDAHSVGHRNPDLSQVRDIIGQDLSWQYAEVLLEENPWRIFQNEKIVPPRS